MIKVSGFKLNGGAYSFANGISHDSSEAVPPQFLIGKYSFRSLPRISTLYFKIGEPPKLG
jgi:hypothetical protein